jgi:hypothetical protein
MFSRTFYALAAASVMSLLGPRPLFVRTAYAAEPDTQLSEIVIYGIDGDTNQLLRYTFETDTFTIIGVVQTAGGDVVDNTEALTWVPSGPAKGMYCIPRDGDLSGKLLRINPLDATAEVVADCAWDDITAMACMQVGPSWAILAWDRNDDTLVAIDPLTGMATSAFSISREFEGFALGPDGTLYANTDTELFTIDLVAGTAQSVGPTGTDKMESLEYAFGDYAPKIDVPGVPAAWTADGVLIGFDDAGDSVRIINPATGATVKYPCSFATVDCEGLVVLTKLMDPYGCVVADPCD